ncbi:hypothetical protein ACIRJS_35785 [Streptomyces sp. NPDC102340]|uniref:Lsr2 family DNA-binding protein n=1 Tax=unclassified Streptomyces TaxID=2593676 RepID=UPI003830AEB7
MDPEIEAGDGVEEPAGPPAEDALHRWARENGIVLHDRGRVPRNIREAYDESQ